LARQLALAIRLGDRRLHGRHLRGERPSPQSAFFTFLPPLFAGGAREACESAAANGERPC
jgi:hypothetical protein